MKLLSLLIALLVCASSVSAAKASKMDPGSGTRNSKTTAAQAKARKIKIDGAFGIKLGQPFSGATAPASEGRLRVTPPAPAGFDVYYITLAADKTVASIRAEKKISYAAADAEFKRIVTAFNQKYGFGKDIRDRSNYESFQRNDTNIVIDQNSNGISITYSSTAPASSSGSVNTAGL